MARKLKVFETSLGFFDLAIAAPSMKAALEAWGADSNLFRQGAAKRKPRPRRRGGYHVQARRHSQAPRGIGRALQGNLDGGPRHPPGGKPKRRFSVSRVLAA